MRTGRLSACHGMPSAREAVWAVDAGGRVSRRPAVAPFWKHRPGHGVLFRGTSAWSGTPRSASFVRCVADGSWPLWDAYRGFGQPLLADPERRGPLSLTWLNLVVPPWTDYTLFVVAHLGSRASASIVGSALDVSRPSGRSGAAAAWVLSGPFLSLASMWHHLAGAAWIPWVFWAAEGALERSGVRPLVGLALAVAAQVLAGSPDYSLLTVLALAVYVGARCWSRPPSWRAGVRLAVRLGFAAALALLASAAQWLPTLEWALRLRTSEPPFRRGGGLVPPSRVGRRGPSSLPLVRRSTQERPLVVAAGGARPVVGVDLPRSDGVRSRGSGNLRLRPGATGVPGRPRPGIDPCGTRKAHVPVCRQPVRPAASGAPSLPGQGHGPGRLRHGPPGRIRHRGPGCSTPDPRGSRAPRSRGGARRRARGRRGVGPRPEPWCLGHGIPVGARDGEGKRLSCVSD